MGRSPSFRALERVRRAADFCEEQGVSTAEGLEWLEELERKAWTRRQLLGAVAAGAVASAAARAPAAWGAKKQDVRVAIVGAGMGGLACADLLKSKGVLATVFDGNDRVGGRCFSLRGVFPGQAAERGGEFIDTLHKVMLGYAQRFKLATEDLAKEEGEVFYFVDGRLFPEEVVVDEYRAIAPAMRRDIMSTSGAPTADSHTDADVALDFTTLKEWLVTRGAGPVISGVIEAAYIGEYGREIDEQSCLNFLFFAHADRRAKFEPFGIYSDERYHLVDGNDAIPTALAGELAGQIELGKKLVAARKDSAGRVVLTFQEGSQTTSAAFDGVVFAIPFSTLREVDLHPSLELPGWKRFAIDNLVYGTNAKVIVGFDGRPWKALGGEGTSYAKGLPNLQGTWETNPSRAAGGRAVLTDYTGGRLGENLDPTNPQREAEKFLRDLDHVFAGASAFATRDARRKLRVDLWHWPSLPLWKGSYTCNQPGYFTTIADNEGKQVGNLYFAGEHANSFYEWQGFMEGAAISGLAAAGQILDDIKFGRL